MIDIREYILGQMKRHGFRNSRIKGQHPGHTISVGGLCIEFMHTKYIDSDKVVSFSTLRNLKKLHQGGKKVSTLTPGSLAELMGVL